MRSIWVGRSIHGIVFLVFVLSFAMGAPRAQAESGLPQEQIDAAVLSLWKADFEQEVNSRAYDNGICKSTQQLEWVTAPYVQGGAVVGRHRIWQTNVFYEGEHKGRTVRSTVNSFYVDEPQPGTYTSLSAIRGKYPQALELAKTGGNPFEEAFSREVKALEAEIGALNLLKSLAQDEYRASFNAPPDGRKPVMKGEAYTGEEVSLVPTLNVPAALESEERRKRENSLLRRIMDIDRRIAQLAALQRAADGSKSELQRLAALDSEDIVREREELTRQALFYEAEYAKTAEKLMAANREKTLAINEAGTAAAVNGLGDAKDAKALMTHPDATTAVDKMRKASDKYDAIVQEREFFLKTSKEYQFKAEFYKLAERIAARAK